MGKGKAESAVIQSAYATRRTKSKRCVTLPNWAQWANLQHKRSNEREREGEEEEEEVSTSNRTQMP